LEDKLIEEQRITIKKLMRLIFTSLVILFTSICANSQQLDKIQLEQSASRFVEKFVNFNQSHPDEKLYIKTNQDLYHPGDNLWFSAFLIDYYTHKESSISQSIYVKLIDEKNNVVAETKISNYGGISNGDLILSDTLSAGIYQLNGYSTLNKQTKDPNSFFKKYIKIVDKVSNNVRFEIIKSDDILKIRALSVQSGGGIEGLTVKAQVHDKNGKTETHTIETSSKGEGNINISDNASFVSLTCRYLGINTYYHDIIEQDDIIHITWKKETDNFIEGLPGKLLYTLKTSAGIPVKGKGVLLSGQNKLIDSVKTDEDGVGELSLIPYRNRALNIKMDDYDQYFPVPLPDEKGNNFLLRKVKNNLIVNLYSNLDEVKNVFLLGQIRGKIQFISLINFKNDFTEVINIEELPEGILNFYLLDEEGEVLGKTMKLIQKNSTFMDINSVTNGGIEKLDISNISVGSNFNLSVQNEISHNSIYKHSFKDYMLCFSEMDNLHTSLKNINVDNLINTLNSSKYQWFEEGEKPEPYASDFTLGFDKISGQATYENGDEVKNKNIILYSQDSGIKSWFGKTDEQGKFEFLEVDNNPKATLILSASGIKKNRTVNFSIDKKKEALRFNFDPLVWKAHNKPQIKINFDSLMDFTDAIVLNNVVKKGDTYNETVEERRTKLDRVKTFDGEKLQFSGGGGRWGVLSIIQQVTSIYSWNRSTGQVLLRAPQTFSGGYGVIFYLNNVRMGDNMFNLNFLTLDEIDEVKVYRPGPDAAIFPFAPDGVIQFITKKGFVPSNDIKSKHIKVLEGQYNKTRDFDLIEMTPEKSTLENNTRLWKTDNIKEGDRLNYEYQPVENERNVISLTGVNQNGEVIEIISEEIK
jgi:hypothetical protein